MEGTRMEGTRMEGTRMEGTTENTTTGPEGRKIYNTANKLFALSAVEPVAVMIYNSPSFGAIPWETIIKKYRREFALTSYAKIEEYASKFIEYISSLAKHVPIKKQHYQIRATAMLQLHMVRIKI